MNEHHEREDDGLLFSTDRRRVDIDFVHGFLSRESYWVPNIRREYVERAIERSICFGVYDEGKQVAFARVVSDGVGFAWLADVFVASDRRAERIGTRLVAFVMAHPDVANTRRFMLATSDAHALYAKFGFTPLAHPERIMEKYDADALSR